MLNEEKMHHACAGIAWLKKEGCQVNFSEQPEGYEIHLDTCTAWLVCARASDEYITVISRPLLGNGGVLFLDRHDEWEKRLYKAMSSGV